MTRFLTRAVAGLLASALLVPVTAISAAEAPAAGPQLGDARPDFDGDGHADLAVGAPYTNIVHRNTGAVHVFYGTTNGLGEKRRQLWSQDSEGVADKPERGDLFGWSLASGDFDGDGFTDLAIAARWEDRGARDAGAIHVIYGSVTGLAAERGQFWTQDSPGIRDRAEPSDAFGTSLVSADLDGDGYADLAVGVPFEDKLANDAGVVHVIFGSALGLSAARNQVWSQASPGVADRPERGDHFGAALTAGDLDGDGIDDLAIGVPYESLPSPDGSRDRVGVVHVIRGARHGLTAGGGQVWHQDRAGIRERAEHRDQFGQSLAAADVNGDGFSDLVVGTWFEDYRNELSNEGGFHVIYGSRRGLRAKGDQFWHESRRGTRDRADVSDRFGQALATGDFDGDGFADVVVGSPSSDLGGDVHQNRGAVHVFRGSARGLTANGDRYLSEDAPRTPGRSERWDHFGEAVAAADVDGDGYSDLVVGIPWEDETTTDDGAVYVMRGSPKGLTRDGHKRLSAAGSGLPPRASRGGRLGWVLSGASPASGTSRTAPPRI